MIPLEDLTDVTLVIEDTDDHNDHDDRKRYLAIKSYMTIKKLYSNKCLNFFLVIKTREVKIVKVVISCNVLPVAMFDKKGSLEETHGAKKMRFTRNLAVRAGG